MMLDAHSDVADDAEVRCDVCIVGSGPAGITLAEKLGRANVDVVLLEAGGRRIAEASQSFFAGEIVGHGRGERLRMFRYRVFGGTSKVWGGRCLMFDPLDFEQRDYVPDSGWPIPYSALLPYYHQALEACDAGPADYSIHSALDGTPAPLIPGLADGDFNSSQLERWSLPTDFGRLHAAELRSSRSIRVFLNAACVGLQLRPEHDGVESVRARSGSKSFRVCARAFVLAAGALEVPRLLLASNTQVSAGIGNHHDLVGRYYMTHLAGSVAPTQITASPLALHYEKDRHGVYVRRRISVSEAAQRQHHIPNMSFQLLFSPVADPSHGNPILSALFMAKFIRSVRRRIPPGMGIRESEGIDENLRLWLRHLRNVALGAPSLAAFLPKFAYQRFLKRRKIPSLVLPDHGRDFRLHFHAEQTPNPASRVLLSDHRDPFGMPRIKLDFRVNEADTEGIVRAHVLLDGYLRKYGVGSVDCHDASFTDRVRGAFSPTNGHFIGTTRMAASEQQGVVDPDCRVFGQDNLFVASSSVFPTSSHANPTLTIVALAKRLADHLLEDDVLRPRSQTSSCAPT